MNLVYLSPNIDQLCYKEFKSECCIVVVLCAPAKLRYEQKAKNTHMQKNLDIKDGWI